MLLMQHETDKRETTDNDDQHVIKDEPDETLLSSTAPYPINSMRNLVISMTDTRFILMIDADFQVSPTLYQDFLKYLSDESRQTFKTAFVIPAFEYLDAPQVIPSSVTSHHLSSTCLLITYLISVFLRCSNII
jgi:hypothetical protein